MPDWLEDIPVLLREVAKRRGVTLDELGKVVACNEFSLAAEVAAAVPGSQEQRDALFLHRLAVAASTASMVLMIARQEAAKCRTSTHA